jgi:hypothetical protein
VVRGLMYLLMRREKTFFLLLEVVPRFGRVVASLRIWMRARFGLTRACDEIWTGRDWNLWKTVARRGTHGLSDII